MSLLEILSYSERCLKISHPSWFLLEYVIYKNKMVYLEFIECSLEEVFASKRHIYLILDKNMVEVLLLILRLENW